MLSHRNFGTMMNILVKHFSDQILPGLDKNWSWNQEKVLLQLPFYHIYGIGIINFSILNGATGVIMSVFNPDVYCRTIEKYRIRMLMLVPPILVHFAKNPIIDNYDLSSVQYMLTGAAPAGKDLIEEVYRRLPNLRYITQGYGMTECSMSSFLPKLDREKYSAAGKLASNYELKIVDIDTKKELPVGQKGEICYRGPTIMLGYFNRPDATFQTIDPEGYLITGDIGYLDENGWLHIVDRQKELIKVKGYQVPPAELEDLLLSHPGISDCAVIGVSHDKFGEVPKAFVVKKNSTLSEEEVKEFVKKHVTSYKQLLGGVEFVKEIPKSQAGKILRRVLREREKSKQNNKPPETTYLNKHGKLNGSLQKIMHKL